MTQAGSGYVPVSHLTALATGIGADDVAVNGAGNVFIPDTDSNAILEWSAATQKLTTVVSAGLITPVGVAVDPSGNLYIADTGDKTIKEWNASTGKLTTLVSGLTLPFSVALDTSGNVYIADSGTVHNTISTIKEWNVATQTLTTLVSSGLIDPEAVAVDSSGNVYIADSGAGAILEWSALYREGHAPGLGARGVRRRGGGFLGQCLHRRSQQRRGQGMGRLDRQAHHAGSRVRTERADKRRSLWLRRCLLR